MADMDEINAIGAKHNLIVLEDELKALEIKESCNLRISISFFPSKDSCYGDGGALFTNNDALAKSQE